MNDRSERIRNILVPIISVILGFVLGAVLMLVFGFNPIEGYNAMFSSAFQSKMSIGEILVGAGPLIFTALGFSVANSAGFFNVGLSGQALCGWVASIWVALSMPDSPKFVVLPLAIIAGALAGAAAAAIPGLLRAFFGTSEVIVTIMMNYVILYVANHIVNHVMSPDIISNKGVTKGRLECIITRTLVNKLIWRFAGQHGYYFSVSLLSACVVLNEANNARV